MHCDPTASHYLKTMMDAIFGKKQFRNEIVWCYSGGGIPQNDYPRKHDTILRYSNGKTWTFYVERKPYKENTQLVGIHSTYSGQNNKIDLAKGTPITDWWIDIPTVTGWNPQRTGYPTQKPIELYERIIKSSSNVGDIVLDPFAGCATTLVSAEKNNRKWVGIDIWAKAHEIVIARLQYEGLLGGPAGESYDVLPLFGDIHYETKPPHRSDGGEAAAPYMPTVHKYSHLQHPWQKLTRAEIRKELEQAQSLNLGYVTCAACGRELEPEFMELDHISPRSERGANDISNRILLCRPCNGKKSNTLTLSGLIKKSKKDGWMKNEEKAKQASIKTASRVEEIKFEMN